MNLVIAEEIYKGIQASNLEEHMQELVKKAFAYARIRSDWFLYDAEQKEAKDFLRTRVHDALIKACNDLSCNMAEAGENNSWRERLGVGDKDEIRKRIGDFAYSLHAILGIKMR